MENRTLPFRGVDEAPPPAGPETRRAGRSARRRSVPAGERSRETTQGYCTGCSARVTVRDGRCLLGHPVDPTTMSRAHGRHTSGSLPPSFPGDAGAAPVATPRYAPGRAAPDPRPAPSTASPSTVGSAAPGTLPAVSETNPTTELVAALWEATGPLEPVSGWVMSSDASSTVAAGEKRRRRARRLAATVLVAVVVATAAVASGAPARRAARQEAALAGGREAVAAAAADLAPVVEDLADGEIADPSATSLAAARLASAARDLYSAADGIDDEDARRRAGADADRATALATRLTDTVAYDGILAAALASPDLPVAVDPADVPPVVADVAWWVTSVASLAESLPDGAGLVATKEGLRGFADWLDTWQASYLDGITSGDAATATTERTRLRARIESLRADWAETVAESAALADEAMAAQPD